MDILLSEYPFMSELAVGHEWVESNNIKMVTEILKPC